MMLWINWGKESMLDVSKKSATLFDAGERLSGHQPIGLIADFSADGGSPKRSFI